MMAPLSAAQAPGDAPAQTAAQSNPEPAESDSADPEAMLPHLKDTRFWLSGQANFVFQAHPDFPAAYSGPHSLSPDYEKATSRVMTLYTGLRLNSSTEILVDIEEAGGAALTQGFGLAGNTDLDIVRNPSPRDFGRFPLLAFRQFAPPTPFGECCGRCRCGPWRREE